MALKRPAIDRAKEKVRRGRLDSCWQWTGSTNRKGYPTIWNPGGSQYACRVLWESKNGPIPPGMTIDHLCNNTSCVNVRHFELVTSAENTRRRDERLGNPSARTDRCKNGHRFSGDNLYIDKHGHRVCRACGREKARRHYEAKARSSS